MYVSTLDDPRRPAGDPPPPPRASRRRARLRVLCLGALCLATSWLTVATAHAGDAGLATLADRDGPISALSLGADLRVTLDGAAPGGVYRLVLVDETLATVAEQTLEADASGKAASVAPLWFRSGVVGCDRATVVDPADYRFASFEQAEAVLDGRTFVVEVRDAATDTLVESHPLPVIADADQPLFYFADGSGCPRSQLADNESLYLAAHGLAGDGRDVVVFVVDGDSPPLPGAFLDDVRGEESASARTIAVAIGQTELLALIWTTPESGYYGGVARVGIDTTPSYLSGDHWIGGLEPSTPETWSSPHGITVVPWDCPGCPIDP